MSPGQFAVRASRGQWKMAKHLALLSHTLNKVAQGKIKRLIVTMGPRHGKSELTSRFWPAHYLLSYPNRRIIFGSSEADLAAGYGRKVRDLIQEFGPEMSGVNVRRDSSAAYRWDLDGFAGGMLTAGVGGSILGRGAHLMILDDVLKNQAEAFSETKRRSILEWFKSTAYTRLEPDGAIVIIQTRWHIEDLAGTLITRSESGDSEYRDRWKVLNLPAIAEEDEDFTVEGLRWTRSAGEALWPKRFPLSALNRIKVEQGPYWWNSLYQGRPMPAEGGQFQRSWFTNLVDTFPLDAQFIRYWDKAASEGIGGAYTAGVLLAKDRDDFIYVVDVVRGKWNFLDRNRVIKATTEFDALKYGRHRYRIGLEQEPSSGGKESAQVTVRELAGYPVFVETVSGKGSKEYRAMPWERYLAAGNVKIKRGSWNEDFIEEHCLFPNGPAKDQVDAASAGFAMITATAPGMPVVQKTNHWITEVTEPAIRTPTGRMIV